MVNLETILDTLERCNISFCVYKDEEYEDSEFGDFEVQDLVISCSTEDCKVLAQNHELLIDTVLENYEFAKIVILLSTKDDWIESFKINYTELDEDEIQELEDLERSIAIETDGINIKSNPKFDSQDHEKNTSSNRFRTLKKVKSKQKINLIIIAFLENLYKFITDIYNILFDL